MLDLGSGGGIDVLLSARRVGSTGFAYTIDLDRRLPDSQLVVYPDAGHGGVFQFHQDFVKRAVEFL